MPKFIHAADLHLDSPMRGLSRYEGAPEDELRLATREALKNLVQLAVDERVDFVVIAGDLYDGDWVDYNTGLFFSLQMSRLRALNIPVVMIQGNHDAASKITKSLKLPENVTLLSHKKPETKVLENFGAAIHGQSFPTQAVDYDMTPHYPSATRDAFNIGILHTLAEGQEGHDSYAPCTLDGLSSKYYEYWALGHVHTRALLRNLEPMIVFPGNTQGRHARETEAKGCTIVNYEGKNILSAQHHDLDVVRWSVLRIDASAAANEGDVLGSIREALRESLINANGRLLAVRVEITGATRAHSKIVSDSVKFINEIRSAATDESGGRIWIEKVKILTTPHKSSQSHCDEKTPLGMLFRSIAEDSSAEAIDESLRDDLAALQEKLPRELTDGPDRIDLRDDAQLKAFVQQGRALLIPKLQSAASGDE